MNDKIIGRFEPIGDDKGPKRAAFDVLTKELYFQYVELGAAAREGWQGVNASGFKYSVLSEYWQWVPAVEFEIVDGPVESADGGPAFGRVSVLDYFAAKAMQAALSNENAMARFRAASAAEGFPMESLIATASFLVADAMLQERAK